MDKINCIIDGHSVYNVKDTLMADEKETNYLFINGHIYKKENREIPEVTNIIGPEVEQLLRCLLFNNC